MLLELLPQKLLKIVDKINKKLPEKLKYVEIYVKEGVTYSSTTDPVNLRISRIIKIVSR